MAARWCPLVEDDRALREALSDTLLLGGHEFVAVDSAEAALPVLAREAFSLVISDVNMPGMDGHQLLGLIRYTLPAPAGVADDRLYGAVDRAVEAMRQGRRRLPGQAVRGAGAARPGGTPCAGPVAGQRGGWSGGPGAGQPAVIELAARSQRSDSTVLISGESGTGKEVLANYIHFSNRRVPASRSSRSTARRDPGQHARGHPVRPRERFLPRAIAAQPGKFELADGGTILLDEISEMPSACRPSCCAYCRSARWSGRCAQADQPGYPRALATTPRPRARKSRRAFPRDPLLSPAGTSRYRRARRTPADILPLAERLLRKHSRKMNLGAVALGPEAAQCLVRQGLASNALELDNAIQRALILQQGGLIQPGRPVPHRADRHAARGPGAGAHAGNATGHPAERRDSVAGRRPGR